MGFEGFEEFKARVKALEEVSQANEAIASANSIDFFKKWGGVGISVPGAFVDWSGIQAYLMKDNPELFGNWSTHLEVSEAFTELVGDVAQPLIEYINIERKINLAQRLNSLAAEGYVELVFDIEKNEPIYQVAKKGKEHESDINEMIAAYGRF